MSNKQKQEIMSVKNLTSTIEKNGSTTTFTKTFESKTPKGLKVVIEVFRSVINVTSEPCKTKTYFGLSYNGQSLGHYRMDRESLNYYLNFVDKWSDKL
jgi:hypothetical protein